jgi:hypothetical protein
MTSKIPRVAIVHFLNLYQEGFCSNFWDRSTAQGKPLLKRTTDSNISSNYRLRGALDIDTGKDGPNIISL